LPGRGKAKKSFPVGELKGGHRSSGQGGRRRLGCLTDSQGGKNKSTFSSGGSTYSVVGDLKIRKGKGGDTWLNTGQSGRSRRGKRVIRIQRGTVVPNRRGKLELWRSWGLDGGQGKKGAERSGHTMTGAIQEK